MTRLAGLAVMVLGSACAGSRPPVAAALVTGGELPAPGAPAWVVGIARSTPQGPAVEAAEHVVSCAGQPAWPDSVEGRPIVVAGTLTRQASGAPGVAADAWQLSPCTAPPPRPSDGLIEAERDVFAAIAHRDRATMLRLIAPEFVLRMPGEAEVGHDLFLTAVATFPAQFVSVEGEGLVAHRTGDTGIVRGVQVARVRTGDTVAEDRAAFVDVFVRRDGRWIMTFALSVALPAPPAP